jgi:hypothetical protein
MSSSNILAGLAKCDIIETYKITTANVPQVRVSKAPVGHGSPRVEEHSAW